MRSLSKHKPRFERDCFGIQMEMDKTMTTNKVILITGASSGFGKETAAQLIKQGYIVYPAARRLHEMADLEALGGRPMAMDVTIDASVESGIARIIEEQGRIDVVINNAGYGFYSLVETADMAEAERVFNVNVFGTARVAKMALPHMRKARSGRIINIASVVGKVSGPMFGWYAGSKHAVEALSDAMRAENVGFGIDVAIVEPGGFKTEFEEVAMDNLSIPEDQELAENVENFKKGFLKYYASCPGPKKVVDTLLNIVSNGTVKTRYPVGDAWMPMLMRRLFGDKVYDNIMRKQFGFK